MRATFFSLGIAGVAIVTSLLWLREKNDIPVNSASPVVPFFVSTRSDQINARKGPSLEHSIAWVYRRAGQPVEVIARGEIWYRIRDKVGKEAWVNRGLLSPRRSALVQPWATGVRETLYLAPDRRRAVARAEPNVIVHVFSCDGEWCKIAAQDYSGYIRQNTLWGVYPGERF